VSSSERKSARRPRGFFLRREKTAELFEGTRLLFLKMPLGLVGTAVPVNSINEVVLSS